MSFFNWRTRPGARPPQDEAREIVDRAMRDQADAYAACLRPGSEILEDTDGPTIAPYRRHLPAALIRRGLRLEPIPGGWRVQAAARPLPTAAPQVRAPKIVPVECKFCGGWFAPGCGHGVGSTLVIRW
jgi:hypothetical protein